MRENENAEQLTDQGKDKGRAKDKYIVYYISRTKQKMQDFIQMNLQEGELQELVPSYGNILTVLYEQDGRLTMQEIAKRTGKDKSTVTHLVNRLSALGYVEKEPCRIDRRVTYVVLTEKARKIRPSFDAISDKVRETAYRGFSEEEKEMFLELLKRMNQNFSV